MKPIRGRTPGKSDRRSGPLGSDRRAKPRRRADDLSARVRASEAKREATFAQQVRSWRTSKIIGSLVDNLHPDRRDLIAAELDARIPPRSLLMSMVCPGCGGFRFSGWGDRPPSFDDLDKAPIRCWRCTREGR